MVTTKRFAGPQSDNEDEKIALGAGARDNNDRIGRVNR
jgi:hypothetical protein